MIKVKFIRLLPVFFTSVRQRMHSSLGQCTHTSVKWWQINTPKARIIFQRAGQPGQPASLQWCRCLIQPRPIQSGPQRKWNVILQNQTTVPNAYVRMAPKMSELYMTPPQDNFSTGSLRWMITSSFTKTGTYNSSAISIKASPKYFHFPGPGRTVVCQRPFLPTIFFEGDAVWQETLVSQQGRKGCAGFYNTFKSLWAADKNYPWMKYRSGSLKICARSLPDRVLLGGLRIWKYGPDFGQKLPSKMPYALKAFFNKAIERHSGIPFKQFREDAIRYFKRPGCNNTCRPLNFITPVHRVMWLITSFPFWVTGIVVSKKKSFSQVPAFYRIVNGREEKITGEKQCLDEWLSPLQMTTALCMHLSKLIPGGPTDYSVINIVDIHSKTKTAYHQSKIFSPDINGGHPTLVVKTGTDGWQPTGHTLMRLPKWNGDHS